MYLILQKLFLTVELIRSVAIISEYQTPQFDPKSQWQIFNNYPDYDITHVICYDAYPEFGIYNLDLNNSQSGYVQSSLATFFSWSDFLLEIAFAVDPKNLEDNPLLTSPDENAEKANHIEIDEEYMFAVAEVKDNWIKVEVVTLCGGESLGKSGWIRWKDSRELLIDISYIC